jgi:hypothetical protein
MQSSHLVFHAGEAGAQLQLTCTSIIAHHYRGGYFIIAVYTKNHVHMSVVIA